MADKKPEVFPFKEEVAELTEKALDNVPDMSSAGNNPMATEGEKKAAQEMYERNKQLIEGRAGQLNTAIDNASDMDTYREERMKVAEAEKKIRDEMYNPTKPPTPTPPTTPPPTDNYVPTSDDNPNALPEGFVKEIMEPQWDAPYDMIPLPSEGKLYNGVKSNIRVAYLNASDENLLTSPHILQSDKFLEILLNRKILEPNLKYGDLHVGDRNAIMIWLRATAYGTSYPITLLDNDNQPFDYDFDLSDLKTEKLKAEPDTDKLFSFELPTNNSVIKFKFLTTNEVDDLEGKLLHEKDVLKLPVNNTVTYTLMKHVVSINGETDSEKVENSINYMRSSDRKALMEYIDEIESGLNLEIEVKTPSGESVITFLPLNFNFFWPNS